MRPSPNNMTTTSLDSYIGFAVRSRKAVFGAEGLLAGRMKVFVVLYDAALGKDGRKKLAKLRESSRVEMFETPEGYLARLLKRDGVKVIGIAEQHLAQAIVNTFTDGTPSDGGR